MPLVETFRSSRLQSNVCRIERFIRSVHLWNNNSILVKKYHEFKCARNAYLKIASFISSLTFPNFYLLNPIRENLIKNISFLEKRNVHQHRSNPSLKLSSISWNEAGETGSLFKPPPLLLPPWLGSARNNSAATYPAITSATRDKT